MTQHIKPFSRGKFEVTVTVSQGPSPETYQIDAANADEALTVLKLEHPGEIVRVLKVKKVEGPKK